MIEPGSAYGPRKRILDRASSARMSLEVPTLRQNCDFPGCQEVPTFKVRFFKVCLKYCDAHTLPVIRRVGYSNRVTPILESESQPAVSGRSDLPT